MLIGAGAKILGNIEVGHCARIAAGSVVLKPVPNNVTVAGVPAKVVGDARCAEPSRTMDQMFPDNRGAVCYPGAPGATAKRREPVDVAEVKKLDAYLRKLFGNPHIRVVPKKGDIAEVFIGEDDLGELIVDDEDGDRSYNFRMVIQVSNDPSFQPVPTLTAYLRAKFENDNIRVVVRPKKTNSLEVYIGEEFLGVLFVENENGRRSYIFELPILDVDLDGGPVCELPAPASAGSSRSGGRCRQRRYASRRATRAETEA